ncbi:jg15268, partial [Pararge aegeria aegeria]
MPELKINSGVHPRPLLDMVISTVTLSIVTKRSQDKQVKKCDIKGKPSEHHREDD